MRTFILHKIFAAFLPALLLAGCEESSTDVNTIRGSGKVISEIRTAEECSRISIVNTANVYLTQDTIQYVRVEADDNIIAKVITKGENGNLNLGLEEGSYSDITLRIYVSLKNYENLSITGAGQIMVTDSINCGSLTTLINGAGTVLLKGTCSTFNCSVNGAGNITAMEFISQKCKVTVNGTGNCTVYAVREIDASINGTGSIDYYGNPAIIKTSVSGTGRITAR